MSDLMNRRQQVVQVDGGRVRFLGLPLDADEELCNVTGEAPHSKAQPASCFAESREQSAHTTADQTDGRRLTVLLTRAPPPGLRDCGGGMGSERVRLAAEGCQPSVVCFGRAPNGGRRYACRRLQDDGDADSEDGRILFVNAAPTSDGKHGVLSFVI